MTRPSSNGSDDPINKRNQRRLHGLIDTLFNDYSKLLVIRLDFYIQKDSEEDEQYDYMNEAFDRLRNNRRSNRLFEHYITYAARLEYGTSRKWHYHVLFFFDGQRVRDDYGLAKAIGASRRRAYRQGQYKPKQGRLGRPREVGYHDAYA